MVQSKILAEFKNLLHYFGDKGDSENLTKLGLSMARIVFMQQIHGNKISILTDDNNRYVKGSDGAITYKPLMLGIRTADCMPIFFYDPQKKIIAAVHAGWKGLASGIIKNAIVKMEKLGCNALDLIVSVGPHIQVCCYNVSQKRKDKFKKYKKVAAGLFLNLGEIARQQLINAAVPEGNIEISDICTSCNSRFWSFRRDKQTMNRMINIIGIIPN